MKLPNPSFTLASPSPKELEQTQPLLDHIFSEIDKQGGSISFARFMELALYTPKLGYYSSERPIFGEHGDFITAPELTPIFSRCLAIQTHEVLSKLNTDGDILEFGAGAGTMACDILLELEALGCLPRHYFISELSSTLRERQRLRIDTYAPHLLPLVSWIDQLPKSFSGIMLGNEILDAIPTHRVRFNQNGQHEELRVSHENDRLIWVSSKPKDKLLSTTLNQIFAKFGQSMPEHYETEINLRSKQWIQQISHSLTNGVALFIDYGFSENEFYRPERKTGSLMCHYKHTSHDKPLTHVGLQDITSHVNFTSIAETAFNSGLTISGYTTQTYFLLGCGLENLLSEIDINDTKQFVSETQPVKVLILPDEMGELFKVIALSKNFDEDLLGFSVKNLLERL